MRRRISPNLKSEEKDKERSYLGCEKRLSAYFFFLFLYFTYLGWFQISSLNALCSYILFEHYFSISASYGIRKILRNSVGHRLCHACAIRRQLVSCASSLPSAFAGASQSQIATWQLLGAEIGCIWKLQSSALNFNVAHPSLRWPPT